MYSFIAVIIFGFIDYIGYNLARKYSAIIAYRIIQVFIQACIAAILWKLFGVWSAASFMLLWWTFNADFVYYFFYNLNWLKIEGEAGFRLEVLGNQVTWAWWTPIGLFMHGGRREVILWNDLAMQAAIGVIGSILIWIFL